MMHQGQPALLLRDPLRITERMLVIAQQLAPVLTLMDGTRNLGELRASLEVRFGLRLNQSDLEYLIKQLDSALLLHNDHFAQTCQAVLEQYRQADYRLPSSAGASYPAEPDELAAMLDGYLAAQQAPAQSVPFKGRGVISPHIDFGRGGPVYAQVWERARDAACQAEVAVIFGTDHNGGEGALTLTRQNYATPYGVLPTATGVVDAVARAIGSEFAFGEELHHIGEHSIELAAVWLHHVRQRQPIELVPVLCGSFHHFISTPFEPENDPAISAALGALEAALEGRPTLVVAAADLAHVGPAFGDPLPVDIAGRARLAAADDALIESVCAGDARAFYEQIADENDRRNVCGLSPIYLTLRLLGQTTGQRAGYERCPADQEGGSWVSVCGVLLE
jgi:AmmeMemoRadiSam system protein B